MYRRHLLKTAGVVGSVSVLGSGSVAARAADLAAAKRGRPEVMVKAKQNAGKSVHWIKPGPRPIDPHVFGTPTSGPSSPQLVEDWIEHQIWRLDDLGSPAAGLLAGRDGYDPLPLPVGLPEGMRKTNDDGDRYTESSMPVPFSNNTVGSDESDDLDGELDLRYRDRQGYAGDGNKEDAIDLNLWLTDPDGNKYTLDIHHLERHDGAHLHGRGVMTGVYMHGTTGIGTPLMPTQYAFGAFWAIGDVLTNGEIVSDKNRDRVIHLMSTQTVRKADGYTLAFDDELPLGEDGNPDAYLGEETHTHVMLPPIKETDVGPRKVGLKTEVGQPFIHFMFDEDDVQFD